MNEHDIIEAFRRAMADQGVRYTGVIEPDSKMRRIHIEGDKTGRNNGWYILHFDERPAGAFGTMKGEQKFTWSGQGVKELTPEERREIAARAAAKKAERAAADAALQAKAAERAQSMWDAAKPADAHPYLAKKGVAAYELRVGAWLKERKDDGTIYTAAKGALLIPIRDERKNIVNLQAVFAEPIKQGDELRAKDFVYGGRKKGCWFTIGKPTVVAGDMWVVICEGYATGASIHAATGLAVVVAFDAGNMVEVARTVHRLMPKARILIAADNDAFTKNTKGEPWNPGLEKAAAAAMVSDGVVVAPAFRDLTSQPTDFNDLAGLEGDEAVRGQLLAVLAPPAAVEPEPPEPPPYEPPPYDAIDPNDNGIEGPPDEPDDDVINTDGFFRVLGHDRDHLFVYQYEKKMIVRRRDSDWSEAALVTIAPLKWWEREFPGEKSFNKKMAHDWLVRLAYKRGHFDPNSVRGRGAWRDDGRVVYHFGNKLWVDGAMLEVTKIDSSFVYEQARRLRLPAATPMEAADGKMIVEVSRQFGWTRPASAILLAGWCALAPICGALRWRPHIWITGGAGSGKTTILNDFVMYLMNGAAIYAQGNSTEAGIRQTLKTDALPVGYDESEQNNDREELRVQNILSLSRQSSTESEAKTLKGTQGGDAMDFVIRSMFVLSSIQVGMKHQADVERFAVLGLNSSRGDAMNKSAAADNWARISASISKLKADPELPSRLLHRSLMLLPTTLQNIEVFARAASQHFGSQREGDQYGAMLAGAWSLVSTKLATPDEAVAMIKRYDWTEYLEGSEVEESSKALSTLLGKMLRVQKGTEVSVYELVARAADYSIETCDVPSKEADAILRRHGMRVIKPTTQLESYQLLVANNFAELDRLMAGTPYAADMKGQLLRVPGAERHDPENFNGTNARSVAIPIDRILDIRRPAYSPTAFDVDDDLPF